MKRRFTTALVMLLAFALLIGTTAITASAETTYEPIGGSTTLVKNLVVDKDASPTSPSTTPSEEALRRTQPLRPLRSSSLLSAAELSALLYSQMQIRQTRSTVFRQTLTRHSRPQAKSTLKKPFLYHSLSVHLQNRAYTDLLSTKQTTIYPA